jgi:hypothetical protein
MRRFIQQLLSGVKHEISTILDELDGQKCGELKSAHILTK